jgi:lysophospholipase L1-like esterase
MKREFFFICLGDSLTAGSPGFSGFPGYNGNPKSQYEYWLDEKTRSDFPSIDVEYMNYGVGGNTTFQIFQRYRSTIIKAIPEHDYVIVWIGINDIIGHTMNPEDVVANIEEMYDEVLKRGKKVIAMEIAPVSLTQFYLKRVQAANAGIHRLAKARNMMVVPLYDALVDKEGKGMDSTYDIGDGVHFNVNGYQKIAETIYKFCILKILSKN